ncbi:MAG: 4-hydroxybenzoyl-CoA reductase [Actinomycetia bacterium]|nr:4-hydroxybenzoyl-CoA reductase [Actinomycetes bacterium]
MLRLPPFELHRPASLAEAARILDGEGPGARVVSGGTDLWPGMKRGHHRSSTVVSLMSIPELTGIENGAGTLRIGAATLLRDVAADPMVRSAQPALAAAITEIASPAVRNMATIGGNLCIDTRCTYYDQGEMWRTAIGHCLKTTGDICWVAPGRPVCQAISAGDTAPILCALEATVRLVSVDGERVVPMESLYTEDGAASLTLGPGEILAEIIIDSGSQAEGRRAAFRKLRRRGSIDFAVLSVAAAVSVGDDGLVRQARIHLGAVAPRPLPATEASASLVGRVLDEESIVEAARLARAAAAPFDNTDFRPAWRRQMVEVETATALREVLIQLP